MSNSASLLSLTKKDLQLYKHFYKANPYLFNNIIIENFFKNPNHVDMLIKVLTNETEESRVELDDTFRRFLFRIRFISYLNTKIKYSETDYHRKLRKDEYRNVLIFDKPVDDEETCVSYGEYLLAKKSYQQKEDEVKITINPKTFMNSILDDRVYLAVNQLTERQRIIITLAYAANLTDTEIAYILNITQQAVTKTRSTALTKMKELIMIGTRRRKQRKSLYG